jgi:protein O-GlcNAc transferase
MTSSSRPIDVALEHHRQGRLVEAERIYRAILETTPHHCDALHLLGVAAYQAGRPAEAIELIRRAIDVDGCHATFHNSLGSIQLKLGDLPAAADSYRRSIMLDMDCADVHRNLALVLRGMGRFDEELASLRRAVMLDPENPVILNSLGVSLGTIHKVEEAADCYRRALAIREEFWDAHTNLGNVCKDLCRIDEAIPHYRRAIELAPDAPTPWSNMLCALQYRDGITPGELAARHAEFDRAVGEPLRASWRPHDNDPDPDRPLRIGFLSPDLHRHPVGYFLVGVIERLDPGQARAFCYSTSQAPDDLTARMQAKSEWRDVRALTDDAIAESIRADAVDILFDLAGHTGNNRILVLARRPAPIQITWAGYVGTTGLSAVDYLLADGHEVPPELEGHYREQVLRMPDAYVCYEPPAEPPVAPLPALTRGHVTFGSFSNPGKLGPQVVVPWARILERVPGSRLLLKYGGIDDPAHARRITVAFADQGIAAERLVLEGRCPQAELLEHYGRVDIALDPFPYGGGVTTLEAVWMGVPVVTLPGETFASRHALTHLSTIGLTDTIARDLDEYVDIAVRLAADLTSLAELRAGLRDRMAASPICDPERFAADFMGLLRAVWRERVCDLPQVSWQPKRQENRVIRPSTAGC